VLTRTPFNPPLYPSEAWKIIEGMIPSSHGIRAPHTRGAPDVVGLCAADGWAGGRVNDAVHLRCAQKA